MSYQIGLKDALEETPPPNTLVLVALLADGALKVDEVLPKARILDKCLMDTSSDVTGDCSAR